MRWRFILLAIALLAGCGDSAPPEKKQAAPDDNCVGYIIRPNGIRECMERGTK